VIQIYVFSIIVTEVTDSRLTHNSSLCRKY